MSIVSPIDFRSYVQGPRVGAPYARPLARTLFNAAPADLDDAERALLGAVLDAADAVQDVVAERDRRSLSRVRPALLEFGNRWGALHAALGALARLPASFGDRGPRASRVLPLLFPDGVAFVQLDARAAWNEAQRLLDRSSAEGLDGELVALAGADFVDAARAGTAELGEVIGVGRVARELPSSTALSERLNEFSRAVGAYGRLLLARVDETRPASVERFRRAVAPVDQYRVSSREGSAPPEPSLPGDPPAEPEVPGLPGA